MVAGRVSNNAICLLITAEGVQCMTRPPIFEAAGSLKALGFHDNSASCQRIESRGMQHGCTDDLLRQLGISLFNLFNRY